MNVDLRLRDLVKELRILRDIMQLLPPEDDYKAHRDFVIHESEIRMETLRELGRPNRWGSDEEGF